MASDKKDHWSSEVSVAIQDDAIPRLAARLTRPLQAYQRSASFVPKLAGKIVEWLDPQKDDVILDIGCGGRKSTSKHGCVIGIGRLKLPQTQQTGSWIFRYPSARPRQG